MRRSLGGLGLGCGRLGGAHRLTPTSRGLRLVVGEQDRLAADREVAPLRVALVVLGHQDPAQVRVAVEDHAEHVVDLALLVVGGRPLGRHARHVRVVDRHARLDRDAVDRRSCRAARSGRRGAAPRGSSRRRARRRGSGSPCRAGARASPARTRRVTSSDGLVAEEDGVEDAVRVALAQLLGDQLEAGRVRHSCASCRRRNADGWPASVGPRLDDLLGAAAAVARAPALVGVAQDLVRSLRIPCMSASGRGGQPGTWMSTGMNLSAGTIA